MKVSVNRRFSMLSQNAALLVIYLCPRYVKALLVLSCMQLIEKSGRELLWINV
jgi:hypothetical protein